VLQDVADGSLAAGSDVQPERSDAAFDHVPQIKMGFGQRAEALPSIHGAADTAEPPARAYSCTGQVGGEYASGAPIAAV
jgi:hypothetical protein